MCTRGECSWQRRCCCVAAADPSLVSPVGLCEPHLGDLRLKVAREAAVKGYAPEEDSTAWLLGSAGGATEGAQCCSADEAAAGGR